MADLPSADPTEDTCCRLRGRCWRVIHVIAQKLFTHDADSNIPYTYRVLLEKLSRERPHMRPTLE
jgi:hypothetical protein